MRLISHAMLLILILCTLHAFLHSAAALEFDMVYQTKCIMEEINDNVLVLGDFSGERKTENSPVMLDVKVMDPMDSVLYTQFAKSSGTFGFTSKSSGDFKACFTTRDASTAKDTKIKLDWKTGVAATNWDNVAKKENLDQMATELRKLEDTVKEVHMEMKYLRGREEQMRNLNEATNERVAFYSISSLVVCVALGLWQLWHLRSFFQRKKLL